MRITETEYAALMSQRRQPTIPPPLYRPSKYRAVMEECEGIKFHSKREAKYFRELQARVHLGEVKYFLRQVPFHLRGGIKHVIDFVEFWRDGSVHYIEVKGFDHPIGRLKRKLVEDQYPIQIEVVK